MPAKTTQALLLLLAATTAAQAQFPVPPANFPHFERIFKAAPTNAPLKCTFQTTAPTLSFSLRYDAGYTIQFPGNTLKGPGHTVDIALKVTPLAAPPFFLASHIQLPATNTWRDVSGSFRIDPGSYRIESLVVDDTAHVCRSEWKVDTKPLPIAKSQPAGGVTIFLDAAPTNPRKITLPPEDITMLTGAVSALTRNIPAQSLRIVVLNLDLKKEFLLLNSYTRTDSRTLRSTLSAIQLATVDYREQLDSAAYLTALISREVDNGTGTVIFLGPQSREHQNFAADAFASLQDDLPASFYLQYHRPHHVRDDIPFQSDFPGGPQPRVPDPTGLDRDTIERLMQKLHGRTITFSTPLEFARALDKIYRATN